jgi:hypothetical protein
MVSLVLTSSVHIYSFFQTSYFKQNLFKMKKTLFLFAMLFVFGSTFAQQQAAGVKTGTTSNYVKTQAPDAPAVKLNTDLFPIPQGDMSATEMYADIAILGGGTQEKYQGPLDVSRSVMAICDAPILEVNQTVGGVCMAFINQTGLAQSYIPLQPNAAGAGVRTTTPSTGQTLTLSLWDALPNAGGNMLASGSTVTTGDVWIDVFWDPVVSVTPGNTYFIVIEGTVTACIEGSTANPYPDGNVFANPGYGAFPGFDYTFRTYSCATGGGGGGGCTAGTPLFDSGITLLNFSNGFFADAGFPQWCAEDFILSSDVTNMTVEWLGGYFPNGFILDNFTIDVYNDAAGLPGALITSIPLGAAVNAMDTGTDAFGADVYSYSADISMPAALVAGTTYRMAINNNIPGAADTWFWLAGPGNGFNFSVNNTTWFSQLGTNLALTITCNDAPPGGGGGCNATDCVDIVCPPDETVACITDVDLDPLLAVATGNCSPIVGQWVTNAFISGVPGCPGTTYTFTYKAVDADGNLGCCDRVITIDNAPPVVTAPAGGTVNCYDEISVDVNNAVVTGACAGYELFLTSPEVTGEFGCPGTTYTFTYRLVETCGRVVEATQVFTEANNAAPVVVAPADVTCSCLAGITPNPDNAEVVTSCGTGSTVTVTGPQTFGPLNCNGTVYRYTYTVTDDCGRTSSDTQDFTISNGPPVFENCPGDNWLVLNCEDYGGEAGTIAVIEAWIASVTATTSCNFPLTVFNNFNPNNINTCVNNGYNTVTFRATDNCGRTSFCTGTYVVVDTEAPTITTPAQDHWEMCNYNTQANLTAWVQAHGGALATDGCSGGNISWQASPANPQINCIGAMGTTTVTVQFIVTDNCGNKSNTTATFNALMAPGNDLNDNGDDQINENKGLALLQNRPNPFKDETLISFNLPESTYATLTIYDVDGRTLKVVEGNYDAGYNEVGVSASELGATGVMYYRLMTDNGTITKTMLVID